MSQPLAFLKSIDDFLGWWGNESGGTRKIFGALTDTSLKQSVAKDRRTLGRLAWHIICSIPEMTGRTGLQVPGPKENDPIPASAAEIQKAYDRVATSLLNEVKSKWTDPTLKQQDDMYGEMWERSQTLAILIHHEIHHRAQMTVLMRQAGLQVPGIYGPSYEEWKNYGMEPPAV